MSPDTPPSTPQDDLRTSPGPNAPSVPNPGLEPHRGVLVIGENDDDGPKAFYIHVEARSGCENEVIHMLRDIFDCVLEEPATGPWFGLRYSKTVFGIFEAFPSIAGRDAHVAGRGGDIFRDVERMNQLLVQPAHVYRVDILLIKALFAK